MREVPRRSPIHSAAVRVGWSLAVVIGMAAPLASRASAQEAAATPQRPVIKFYRWQEDWSVLADPALRTQPFDNLKYIPLSVYDPKSYVSLGATLRERYESNSGELFGTKNTPTDAYVIQRLWIHADVHLNDNWQIFTQLEDARVSGKNVITPADQDRLDLRLAFVAYTNTIGDGTFKARVGRQDFSFDLQRFVSSRDGPNVRQAFDAVWGDWETGAWRFIGFVSRPVQYRDAAPFDDISNDHFRFSTLRVERKVLGDNELSAYYSRYELDNTKFLDAVGNERRDVFDARFAGKLNGFDWDLESMGQIGSVGARPDTCMGGRCAHRLYVCERRVVASDGGPVRRRFGRSASGRRQARDFQSAVSERLLFHARRLYRLHEPDPPQAVGNRHAGRKTELDGCSRLSVAADHSRRDLCSAQHSDNGDCGAGEPLDRLL